MNNYFYLIISHQLLNLFIHLDLCISIVVHSLGCVQRVCLRPYGLQHARLPCPSPFPGACSNSRPLSQWCHPTILSSVVLFFWLQSFPASGSFLMSKPFASGGQILELQLQHQSFQWILRIDFLKDKYLLHYFFSSCFLPTFELIKLF